MHHGSGKGVYWLISLTRDDAEENNFLMKKRRGNELVGHDAC